MSDPVRNLVEQFMPLAQDEARISRGARRLAGDFEVLSAAMWGLLEAARSFVPSRQSDDGFATHARWYIRARIRNARIRPATRLWLSASLVNGTGEGDFLDTVPEREQGDSTADDVREALGKLSPLHSSLLRRHFGLDGNPMSVTELALADGMAPGRIRLMLRNAKDRMREAVVAVRTS